MTNIPVNERLVSHTYSFDPTGVAVDDVANLSSLIAGIPVNTMAKIKIRDNGLPVRLGVTGAATILDVPYNKSIFFEGETKNVKIIWGVPGGTGGQGLYSIVFGGTTSPLRTADVMPANVTRTTMSSVLAKRGKITASAFSGNPLVRGDRVLLWADDDLTGVNPHAQGGTQRPGELHRVEYKVTATNDYILDNHVWDAMTVNPRIAKIVMGKNCGFANLTFGYNGPDATARGSSGYNIIFANYQYGFVCENIHIDETGAGTILVQHNDKSRVTGITSEWTPYASDYGVWHLVNKDFLAEDCHTHFVRHLQTSSGIADPIKQWTLRILATSGQYRLTYNGQQTADIAYNANAATIIAALEALSNVGAGEMTVVASNVVFTGTSMWTISTSGALLTSATTGTMSWQNGTTPLSGGSPVQAELLTSTARYGNGRGTIIRNCKASIGGSGKALEWQQIGFDTHAEEIEITYDRCEVEIGSQDDGIVTGVVGFNCRSRNAKFIRPVVNGNVVYATTIKNLHVGMRMQGANFMIEQARLRDLWYGIKVDEHLYGKHQDGGCVINSEFVGITGHGFVSDQDQGKGVADNLELIGNRFYDCGGHTATVTNGALVKITKGTGHTFRDNFVKRDTGRYSFDFGVLTTSNVELYGNYCLNYSSTFGAGKLGLRGSTGEPYGAPIETSQDAIQAAFEDVNYTYN